MDNPEPGSLSWRLSSHPITLLFFLAFRLASLLTYLLGVLFTKNYILIFILTTLLLALDFYNVKNIAGRRLVGLRWWNEVDPSSGDTTMVFESVSRNPGDEGYREVNKTDRRFFWLAMYTQPVLWVLMAVSAVVTLKGPLWVCLVAIALVLTLTNTVAFSRCDKFSHASNIAGAALSSGGLARNLATGMVSRFFSR
ncbi:MAG: hypothetical protein Q9162_000656 [Coniocarpon cinnabarinum]